MNITPDLSPKEVARRKKLSRTMKKRREQGLKRYWAKRRKEAEQRRKKLEKDKLRKARLEAAKKKRKVRRRKPGPKINWYKRRKAAAAKLNKQKRELKPFTFKVMLCRNGKRYFTVGKYRTSEEAYVAFNRQKQISDEVVFPRALKLYENLENSIDECIIIQKTDTGPTLIRNEYGKLVEHKTDLEGWEIIDKFRNNVEETFWVWGYDNRKDRKTFMWIYEELIIGDGFGPYEFKRVFTYKNKLFIRDDNGQLNMVICKSDFDSVRMYNELQNFAKKDKIKQLIFLGDKSEKCPETEKLENEIMSMTGWNIKKTRMNATTYVLKN